MDRDIAQKAIVRSCLKLETGGQARLDRNVLRSAFPVVLDDRPVETQLTDLLNRADPDGTFLCQPIAGGDVMVSRQSRDGRAVRPAAPTSPDKGKRRPQKPGPVIRKKPVKKGGRPKPGRSAGKP
jgi:hypothetical protein